MEAVSILGIISAVVGIADVVTRSVKRLSNLKTKFRDAPFLVSTLIGQLCTVQAALGQLSAWANDDLSSDPRYEQLALLVGSSLDCFRPLIMSLQDRLDQLEGGEEHQLGMAKRVLYVWSEQSLAEYCTFLDRQVNALNLLLQAIQCRTWTEQSALLDDHESQVVLQLARECPSSVSNADNPGVDDTVSFVSENTRALSTTFDFDAVLMASRTYQTAHRHHLRQLVDSQREMRHLREEKSRTKHEQQHSRWNHLRLRFTHPATANTWRKGLLEPSNDTNQDSELGLTTIRSISSGGEEIRLMPFVKALRLAQDQGSFGLDERRIWRDVIFSTVETEMIKMLKNMEEINIPLGSNRNKRHKQDLLSQPSSARLDDVDTVQSKQTTAIEALWNDSGVQSYRKQQRERDSRGNLRWFATNVKRLKGNDFLPNKEDILRCYPQHIGFTSTRFRYQEAKNDIVGMAEARSEQEKWAFCLDHVASAVFAVDLSAHTKNATDDPKPAEMSQQVFRAIANSKHLQKAHLVLVFTGVDESDQEWRRDSVQQHFSDCLDESHNPTETQPNWSELEKKFLDVLPEHFLKEGRFQTLHADLVDPNTSVVQQIFENAHGIPNH